MMPYAPPAIGPSLVLRKNWETLARLASRRSKTLDEEFASRLFGDLNSDFLRPHGDGNIIILSDSNEEEEVHEEDAVDSEATPSAATGIPASTASAADVVEAPTGVQDDNSDDCTPDREDDSGSNGGDEASSS
jgi:hypothetical protein